MRFARLVLAEKKMCGRRSDVTSADIFGGLVVFLVIAGIIAVIFVYIGWIGLLIFLGIGAAVGLVYAIYIYVKSFVSAIKTIGGVSSSNVLKTTLLRWFTLFKIASADAFGDNVSVSKNAITKSHAYRFFSFRKWMWLMVALSTFIFGTALIVAVIVVQAVLIAVAASVLLGIIFVMCAAMFIADLFYAIIFTIIKFPSALAYKDNVFKSFDFSKGASIRYIPAYIAKYFVTVISYLQGIWSENLSLGKNNVATASTRRILSIKKYFLYMSIIALCIIALLVDAVILISLTVVFVPFLLFNFVWILIRRILHV